MTSYIPYVQHNSVTYSAQRWHLCHAEQMLEWTSQPPLAVSKEPPTMTIFSCPPTLTPVSRNKCSSTTEDSEPGDLVRWVLQSHPSCRTQGTQLFWTLGLFLFLLVGHVNCCVLVPWAAVSYTKVGHVVWQSSEIIYTAWKIGCFVVVGGGFLHSLSMETYGSENGDFCYFPNLRRIGEYFFFGT